MRNAFRIAAVILAAKAAGFAGVAISTPKNGAVTNSPLHVAATASPKSSATQIAVMQVYVDGGLVYQAPGNSLDAHFNVGVGNHRVVVKAWDTAGTGYSAPVYVTGSGSGVFLNSPGANATVNGSAHVKASAYSPYNITTLQVYDNGKKIKETRNTKIDTTIGLNPGSHYLVVQAFDAAGTVFMNPVLVHVAGVRKDSTAGPKSGGSIAGPQAYVPGNATSKVDIDQMPGWEHCDICSGINAKGPDIDYSISQGVKSPSLDGNSAIFWLGGHRPWGSALWWKQLGGNDSIHHFVYDVHFFTKSLGVSQALEFDVNHSAGGLKYIYGTECDVISGHKWRVWDTQHAHWMDTGATCNPNNNAWNHVTWELERVGNQTHFIAVTLNGYRQVINKYYYAKRSGVHEINVAFQMDGNRNQANYSVWLDRVSLHYW